MTHTGQNNGCNDMIYVDAPFREVLGAAGLDTVARVLACEGDRLAAWSRTTDTVKVGLNGQAPPTGWRGSLFVKRYFYPGFKRRLKAMLRGTFFGRSRARLEFVSLALLRSRGIQTVRPIAYGERRVWHFLRSCFLITEGVPGAVTLADLALGTDGDEAVRLSFPQRRRVITALAAQVRRMHDAGLVHGRLFWRNVLIRPMGDGGYEFFFLDVPVVQRLWRRGRLGRAGVRDIAELYAIAARFCSRTDLRRFTRAYLQGDLDREQERRWIERVAGLARTYRGHEEYRLEFGRLFNQYVRDGSRPDSY